MRLALAAAAPALLVALVALSGCVVPAPYDYGPYLAHMPRSILVLPPLNDTPDVNASYSFLSTITQPLAERGYYVFPVAVTAELMRENGYPTPGEMRQIAPSKLREVFGADACLYLTIKDWGTSYQVFDSVTTVAVEGRLVDLASGEQFWSGAGGVRVSTTQGANEPISMALASLINQILTSVSDFEHDAAPVASSHLVTNSYSGMLLGPRHEGFADDQAKRRAPPPPPDAAGQQRSDAAREESGGGNPGE